MKRTTFLLFLIMSTSIFSQEKKTFYFSEDLKTITYKEFLKKKENPIYRLTVAENDTAIFKRIKYINYFGQLSPLKKRQLSKILYNKYKIDSLKPLLIHFLDGVPNIDEMPKKTMIKTLGKNEKLSDKYVSSNHFTKNFERRIYIQSKKDYIESTTKHYHKVDNEKYEYIHLYEENKGFPTEKLEKTKTYHDKNNFIKNIFSDGITTYKLVLIHPNGEFYLSNFNHFERCNELLERKAFDKAKKKWLVYFKMSNE